MLIMTHTIVKKMVAKIVPVKEFQDCIENGIDKLIDELSDLRDKLLKQARSKLDMFGLTQINR